MNWIIDREQADNSVRGWGGEGIEQNEKKKTQKELVHMDDSVAIAGWRGMSGGGRG